MQPKQPYVFVSYSSIDEAHAKSLAEYLDSIDVQHFLDKKKIDLGDNFKAKIFEGLQEVHRPNLHRLTFELEIIVGVL